MAIKASTKRKLIAKAGGYCQNPNCRADLYPKLDFNLHSNIEEFAHIVPQSPNGPRSKLNHNCINNDEFENIAVLCPTCHTLVDKNPNLFPEEKLIEWKNQHEAIIKSALSIELSTYQQATNRIIGFFQTISNKNKFFEFSVLKRTEKDLSNNLSFQDTLDFHNKYYPRFNKLNYYDLIKSVNHLENIVYRDLVIAFENVFYDEGYTKKDNSFIKKGEFIEYSISDYKVSGGIKIAIIIQRISDKNNSLNTIPLFINHIGKIQAIEIIAPEPSPIDLDKLISDLYSIVAGAYYIFEKLLVEKATNLNNKIFKNIYDIIREKLTIRNKEYLIDKFWLILGTSNLVLYFFDEQLLINTIRHYKNTDVSGLINKSPLEMTITILTETFSFEKSLAINAYKKQKPLSLDWADAKYIGDAPLIHSAEVRLFNSKRYTGYVPCRCRDHFLIIGCSTEYEKQLMPEIKSVQKKLHTNFSRNFDSFSMYIYNLKDKLWSSK